MLCARRLLAASLGQLVHFVEQLLGLGEIPIVVLVDICQAEVVPLEALDLLCQLLAKIALFSQPKVANLEEHARLINENVRWLDVPMNQALLMNVLQSIYQLLE